ncbi:unnamed protein product [Linum tenue]|uniref:Secreted protein n=1 Tax=Linum tenue TaxID=586396 RepID=A0AAV0P6G0_9ROSI|nr:unnamed protein product [Linum tenue]
MWLLLSACCCCLLESCCCIQLVVATRAGSLVPVFGIYRIPYRICLYLVLPNTRIILWDWDCD